MNIVLAHKGRDDKYGAPLFLQKDSTWGNLETAWIMTPKEYAAQEFNNPCCHWMYLDSAMAMQAFMRRKQQYRRENF